MSVLRPVPDNSPPPFYPVQFHPEFGYLAPNLRFRNKLSLVGKGAAFGLIVGIIVAIEVSPDRQERLRSLSMQSEAATSDWPAIVPVRFVAATLAMRDAHERGRQAVALPVVVAPAPPPAVTPAVLSATRGQIVMPKAKKIARHQRHGRKDRRIERDPRSAYAGPNQRGPELRPPGNSGRPFGFGW